MIEPQTLKKIIKKDNKIKMNDDNGDGIKFLKQTLSHQRDRLVRKIKK